MKKQCTDQFQAASKTYRINNIIYTAFFLILLFLKFKLDFIEISDALKLFFDVSWKNFTFFLQTLNFILHNLFKILDIQIFKYTNNALEL